LLEVFGVVVVVAGRLGVAMVVLEDLWRDLRFLPFPHHGFLLWCFRTVRFSFSGSVRVLLGVMVTTDLSWGGGGYDGLRWR
jgi:hypothetical protein